MHLYLEDIWNLCLTRISYSTKYSNVYEVIFVMLSALATITPCLYAIENDDVYNVVCLFDSVLFGIFIVEHFVKVCLFRLPYLKVYFA